MLDIMKVDHVGIRVSDKDRSIAFYERIGFTLLADAGFEQGHPVIMRHADSHAGGQAGGVVINLLGPATAGAGENVLMDKDEKYPGLTHVAFRVESLEAAEAFLAARGIAITGRFGYKDLRAVFIRDPDRNVIELDAYAGAEPETRAGAGAGYADHP